MLSAIVPSSGIYRAAQVGIRCLDPILILVLDAGKKHYRTASVEEPEPELLVEFAAS